MQELIKDLLLVTLGCGMGIITMCVVQAGKLADEKNWKQSHGKGMRNNEFRAKFVSMVFKQRTVFSANGNRGNRHLLRI